MTKTNPIERKKNNMFKIITDNGSDLSPSFLSENGVGCMYLSDNRDREMTIPGIRDLVRAVGHSGQCACGR